MSQRRFWILSLAVAGLTTVVAAACTSLDSSGLAPDESLGGDTGVSVDDSTVEVGAETDAGEIFDVEAPLDTNRDTGAGGDTAATADASDAAARDAADATLDAEEASDAPDARDASEAAVDAPADVPDTADAGAPFCDPADLDLVACYRLERAEHAIQPWDDSSYDNHGTNTGATFVAGKVGQGASVTTGSLLHVPDRPSTFVFTNKLSVEAWIYPRSFPTGVRAGIVDHDGRYGMFMLPNGALRANALVQLDTPASVLTLNAWNHVAYTYDGATLIVYVNGVSRASLAATGNIPAGGGAGLTLGSNSPNGDELDGIIDSLRIHRISRTAQQICKAAGTC